MRSRAMRIVLFVVLGAMTTLLISWGLAMQSSFAHMPRFNLDSGVGKTSFQVPGRSVEWNFCSVSDAGVTKIIARMEWLNELEQAQREQAQFDATINDIPRWSVMRRSHANGMADGLHYEQAFGWPWLAMRMHHHRRAGANWSAAETDALHVPTSFRRIAPGTWLPLRVIPAGAAANSLLFAWLWFAVLSTPRMAVRAWRQRRNACPTCGYDLRAASSRRCPECGTELK